MPRYKACRLVTRHSDSCYRFKHHSACHILLVMPQRFYNQAQSLKLICKRVLIPRSYFHVMLEKYVKTTLVAFI